MAKYVQIFTTTASKKEAEKIADVLVKKGLAACVQIAGPVQSIYKWKGKIQKEKEWLCIIKSISNKFEEIEEKIKSLHSYKLPEIIALPIEKGSAEYLEWIYENI
ncbi:MAG: divalent-cation tolerance protein CutA [Candidatus Staskawiczbacteria bacterium]|jgi:periplasmic divalent cation tolerance protein